MKEISLPKGKCAIVDDEDFERLNKWKWHTHNKNYVVRNTIFGRKFIHHEVMQKMSGYVVDHINGNPLDNRKENLRYCTHSENMKNSKMHDNNTSGYKGVTVVNKKYRSVIWNNNKRIHLGMYDTAEQAALAYDDAARELHGKYARTNF